MEQKVFDLIDQLAKTLGTTVEFLWSVLRTQAVVQACTKLLFFTLTIIAGIILYKIHRKIIKKNGYDNADMKNFFMGSAVVIWGIFFIINLILLGSVITGFLNPDYWALQEIMNSLNSGFGCH